MKRFSIIIAWFLSAISTVQCENPFSNAVKIKITEQVYKYSFDIELDNKSVASYIILETRLLTNETVDMVAFYFMAVKLSRGFLIKNTNNLL